MSETPGRWTGIFDFVTMITVVIGLTFGAFELRELRAAQQSQAVLQLFQTIQTPEYVEGVGLVLSLPPDLTAEELREELIDDDGLLMQQVRLTFEGLGVMVYREDVSIEWVDEFFRLAATTSWDKFEVLTIEERERSDYPAMMEWHQWLVERLRERADERGPTPAYEAYRDWAPSSR